MSARGACSERPVLIVEDDLHIREALRDVLESEGYRVELAENGREGLEKLRGGTHPCLVLLDMMMPIMNGREFLDALEADDSLGSAPVVVVSANADPHQTRGAAAVLRKPPDVDVLLEIIRRYAGGSV